MSDKFLLVSMVDINPANLDYDTVKKEWEEYKNKGVLREISSALFLYLSAKNYSMMIKLMNYEKFRMLKKVNSSTYGELLKDQSKKGYLILGELLERFNIDKNVTIKYDTVWENIKVRVIKIDIETAVLLDVVSVLNRINAKIVLKKGMLYLVDVKDNEALEIGLRIYLSALQQLITQYRNTILQKYYCDVFEQIAQEEHTYEYTITKFPPCIERALNGDIPEGHRNNALFALANFLKVTALLYGANYGQDEIKDMIWQANSRMPSPLPEREVRNIIHYHIDEHFFKTYGWCSKMKNAGLCGESGGWGVCLRKYFKKKIKKPIRNSYK